MPLPCDAGRNQNRLPEERAVPPSGAGPSDPETVEGADYNENVRSRELPF